MLDVAYSFFAMLHFDIFNKLYVFNILFNVFFHIRYGDGKSCLPNGIPQRVNGIVNGKINSVDVKEQSLHCYIVTQDGRTYTAISR